MKKRLFSFLLCVVMLFSLLPTVALADSGDVTFVKATTITAGNEYLIVAKSSSGSYYALANDSNIKLSVTPSDGKITLSAANAAKAAWTVSAATGDALEKGDFIFTNSGKALNRDGEQNAVGFGTSATGARYGMSYTGGTLRNLNSSNNPYYLGYNSSTFSFSTNNPGNITLYVKGSGTTPEQSEQPTGRVLSLTPDYNGSGHSIPVVNETIDVGKTITVELTNASSSNNYTFAISQTKDCIIVKTVTRKVLTM